MTHYYDQTGFDFVTDMALAPDGAVWYTSRHADRVGWIEDSGLVHYFATGRTGDSLSIAAGPDGAMWFVYGAGQVGRITADGDFTQYSIHGDPFQLVAGLDGAMWMTEDNDNRVVRLTQAGAATDYVLPAGQSLAGGAAVGRDGTLWFKTADGAARLVADGRFYSLSATYGYGDLKFAPNGDLWISTPIPNSFLQHWSSAGALLETYVLGLNSPVLAISGDGTVWFIGDAQDGVRLGEVKGTQVTLIVRFGHLVGSSLVIAGSSLWFGEDYGIGRYTPAT